MTLISGNFWLRRVAAVGLVIVEMLAALGCAMTRGNSGGAAQWPVPISTGLIMSGLEVQSRAPGVVTGDLIYAEVNSVWLHRWYHTFRGELFRLGVTKWDERFDCDRFAGLYAGMAQACFYREMFHSRSRATALALGPYWYPRANGKGGHAIIQALTERGRIFIDPQTGAELNLSPSEQEHPFLQFF